MNPYLDNRPSLFNSRITEVLVSNANPYSCIDIPGLAALLPGLARSASCLALDLKPELIGIDLPVHEPTGSMVVDIGGGTTDIGVISLSGLVNSRNIKVAGDRLNNDIITYIRNEFKILIGEKSAEDAKIAAGAVGDTGDELESTVRGRDLVTGLPREILVTGKDIREAIHHSITQLVDMTKEVLETTPPEIVSDIMQCGIYLVGGGALIRGLAEMLSEMLGGVRVIVAEDPLTAVVRGTGIILDDIDTYKESLKEHENQISPTT